MKALFLSQLAMVVNIYCHCQPLDTLFRICEVKYSNFNFMSYDIRFQEKFLDSGDTLKIGARCKLLRDESDSLFKGLFWIDREDQNFKSYYDLENIYRMNTEDSIITEYNIKEGEASIITGNIISEILRVGFLKADLFSRQVQKNGVHVTFNYNQDRTVGFANIHYPDNPPYTKQNLKIGLELENMNVSQIEYSIYDGDDFQHTVWFLSNIEFGMKEKSYFDSLSLPFFQSYEYVKYELKDRSRDLIKIGETASQFNALEFKSGEIIDSKDVKTPYMLLNFSYLSCPPCKLFIPTLNEISKKFSSEDLTIWSINSVDDAQEDKDRLIKYLDRYRIQYPILMVNKEVDESFKIHSYPTMIILDPERKVAFLQVGYSHRSEQELFDYLNRVLKPR